MAPLKLLAAALLLGSSPAIAQVDRWDRAIGEAAARFGLPERWIRNVMAAESGGRTGLAGRPTTSRAGAMGLMQLMPAAWADMRRIHRLGTDPYDPHDNIMAGGAHLRAMYDRFGYPGLFAAYNAGPARYSAYLATGLALPRETLDYLTRVTGGEAGIEPRPRKARPALLPGPLLFIVNRADAQAGSGPRQSGSLFLFAYSKPR